MSKIDFEIELSRLERAVEALEGMPPDVVARIMAFLGSRFHPSNWQGRPMVPEDISHPPDVDSGGSPAKRGPV